MKKTSTRYPPELGDRAAMMVPTGDTGIPTTSRAGKPLLVCNVGWMTRYQGISNQPDKISGGGRYVDENGHGHECCNFIACADGMVYGHVETSKKDIDRSIRLERLGASSSDQRIKQVDVVWVATDPGAGGRKVVGFYRDATVWRHRQRHARSPSRQHAADRITDFIIAANADNAGWIPPERRDIALGKGRGWIGQANWWFPESSRQPDVSAFLHKVRQLLASPWHAEPADRKGRAGFGGERDPLHNTLVEQAAIDIVTRHFADYTVKSVEKDNRGWDLEVFSGSGARATLMHRIEVKGLSGDDARIGVTPREYKALQQHLAGRMPDYRLCVVTGALTGRPRLRILRHERKAMRWIDEMTAAPVTVDIDEAVAAIIKAT